MWRRCGRRFRESTPGRTPFDIVAIVAGVVYKITDGMNAANTADNMVAITATITGNISLLKLLHLCFLCGVATDAKIPAIWTEVHTSSYKQAGLALLVQHLMLGMGIFCRHIFGHADLLHCSAHLYNFVAGDRFVNPGENPA